MNTLKRMLVALLALLPLATGVAVADTEDGYARIFVFGASFMDSGSHFALTGETAHPPFVLLGPSYGIGGHHFSDGRVWVEVLAQDLKLTEWAKPAWRDPAYGNYAIGYGRARDFNWDPLPSLHDQVTAWEMNGYCTGDIDNPMYDTLFIVDSAYFDFLDFVYGGQNPFVVLDEMTTAIQGAIERLRDCGAYNVLFAFIPPLESAPLPPPPTAQATQSPSESLSAYYNYMLLKPRIVDYFAAEPNSLNITTVDLFWLVGGMLSQPDAFGLTNVTDTCVTFGVTKGAICKNRDEYLFWDPLHPTKNVHAMIAEAAFAALPPLD